MFTPRFLSVSPVGSSCLQQPGSRLLTGATRQLSVSPVGSSCLQPGRYTVEPPPLPYFQYPRSDRVVCNPGEVLPEADQGPFQYPRSDRVVCNSYQTPPARRGRRTFSIPGRIELSATPSRRWNPPLTSRSFSIPGRIELSATRPGTTLALPLVLDFQYPRSDRVVCNPEFTVVVRSPAHSFSIPGRIELSATSRMRAERAGDNLLSVSPVGSSCLQLERQSWGPGSSDPLSVSPVGSSCLQRL